MPRQWNPTRLGTRYRYILDQNVTLPRTSGDTLLLLTGRSGRRYYFLPMGPTGLHTPVAAVSNRLHHASGKNNFLFCFTVERHTDPGVAIMSKFSKGWCRDVLVFRFRESSNSRFLYNTSVPPVLAVGVGICHSVLSAIKPCRSRLHHAWRHPARCASVVSEGQSPAAGLLRLVRVTHAAWWLRIALFVLHREYYWCHGFHIHPLQELGHAIRATH